MNYWKRLLLSLLCWRNINKTVSFFKDWLRESGYRRRLKYKSNNKKIRSTVIAKKIQPSLTPLLLKIYHQKSVKFVIEFVIAIVKIKIIRKTRSRFFPKGNLIHLYCISSHYTYIISKFFSSTASYYQKKYGL